MNEVDFFAYDDSSKAESLYHWLVVHRAAEIHVHGDEKTGIDIYFVGFTISGPAMICATPGSIIKHTMHGSFSILPKD